MNTHQPDSLFVRFWYTFIKVVFGPLVRGIWVKSVDGLEHIPAYGPAIVAFNHQSYFDFICFIAVCPRRIHFLAAEKFFKSAFWRPVMFMMGQIKVERHTHGKEELHIAVHEHLRAGKIIGIFPEGTRAEHPHEMRKAFTGIAKYATQIGVPVIPVGVKGTMEVMSRFDKVPRLKKIVRFHVGAPIHFTEYHGKVHDESVYRDLTNKVMLKLSELSGKAYPHL
jgi:1-acyl-sn-glycerol-3-phosphate acyltransferase